MNITTIIKWLSGIFLAVVILSTIAFLILDRQQEPLHMDEEARKNAGGELTELSSGITHYRLEGPEDGELVVLIHGGMVSGMFAWEQNFRALTNNGFRVLMYDLYGRGYSDRPDENYTPSLLFAQFQELTDSLGIRKPFCLAGLSLGSMVAIDYTQRHPEEVKKLMLISPAARGKFKMRSVLKVPLLSDMLMTAYWYPRTVGNQMQEFYEPEKFPEYEAELREMIRYKGYKESNYSTWVHTLTYNMEPAIRQIGNEGTPVALVLGEQDPYVQPDEAISYRQLIPAIDVFTIPEAGHIVNFEKPEEVNRLMIRFFSEEAAAAPKETEEKNISGL